MRYLVGNLNAVIYVSYVLTDRLALAGSLLEPTKDTLDGEPMLLPVPDDAPGEIPRIALTSKDGRFKCNVTKDYIELVYIGETPTKELEELREQWLRMLGELANVMKRKLNCTIYRLGHVARLIVSDNKAIEVVKERYIKSGALETPRSLELHVLDRMSWDGLALNRWYRISAHPKGKADGEGKEISVIFDINTVAEKKYDFGAESLVAFYDRACRYTINSSEGLL